MKFSNDAGNPQIFAKSFEVIKKSNRCIKFFGSGFFLGETTPTFLRQIVSAIYCSPFGKVRLSSFVDSKSKSKLRNRREKVVFATRFVGEGGGDTPDFGHTFQIALVS